MIKKHEKVEIRFLSSDEDTVLIGTVLLRDSNMVLGIQDPNGADPYLIVGKRRKHFFEGTNTAHKAVVQNVKAKWAELDGIYVGLWVENGYDYLFSFYLPSESKR
jgi:hypothetical protein